MKKASLVFALAAALLLPALAAASPVNVQILGTVEYNQVSIGQFGNVNPGDPVSVTFTLDTTMFLNSASFPTRGYVIDESSFTLTAGSATVHLRNPFPGVPYFVVRDNDPAVDGFFFSRGTDFPAGLPLDEAANGAGTRFFESGFSVSYEGTRLPSLDILDAVGTYDLSGIGSFYFVILDLGFEPIGFIYDQMTISAPVSVESESWAGVKALFR
ncbi:MAG: hypothetical protein KC591_02405 [Gemmatimonadetes bacterium]|nr:hypothetical protein [Gemmatimonadota bacterium]